MIDHVERVNGGMLIHVSNEGAASRLAGWLKTLTIMGRKMKVVKRATKPSRPAFRMRVRIPVRAQDHFRQWILFETTPKRDLQGVMVLVRDHRRGRAEVTQTTRSTKGTTCWKQVYPSMTSP